MWISFRCKLRGEVDQFRVQINTKSIFACCADYLKLRTANAKLEQDHKALQRRYEELLNTTSQYVSAQDQLRATVLQHQQK